MKKYFNLCIFFFIVSCKDNSNIIEINGKLINTDTIQFVSYKYPNKVGNTINNTFGLDSLEKAQDWLEIRIFRYYYSNDKFRLFVIKRRAGQWSGFTAIVKVEYNEQGDSRYIPANRVKDPPKSGWDILGDQLLSKGILNIGKEIPLPNNSSTDGNWVSVEYASKEGYREYTVQDPEDSEILGAKRLTEIIRLIEKELNFENFATHPLK